MLKHSFHKHTLNFKRPSGTSRGVLKTKDSWILKIWHEHNPGIIGIGECSLIEGLSLDSSEQIESIFTSLEWTEQGPTENAQVLIAEFPAIQFAIETALLDLDRGGNRILFPSPFTEGQQAININGLIWMGDTQFMLDQIREKIDKGFRCVKLKIGAIDFEAEIAILKHIRSQFSSSDIELRVDANGAFDPADALQKLQQLAAYDLHSIEQPIRQGQIEEMAALCAKTPLSIALDEELIGVKDSLKRKALIEAIQPQYIILKPSLVGGIAHSTEWINIAEENNVGWWITSALESNIGLNAIAQWTATLDTTMYQGLGTGQLFTNNIDAPLVLSSDRMYYDPELHWGSI